MHRTHKKREKRGKKEKQRGVRKQGQTKQRSIEMARLSLCMYMGVGAAGG